MKGYNEGSLNVVTILSIGEPRQYLVLAIGFSLIELTFIVLHLLVRVVVIGDYGGYVVQNTVIYTTSKPS